MQDDCEKQDHEKMVPLPARADVTPLVEIPEPAASDTAPGSASAPFQIPGTPALSPHPIIRPAKPRQKGGAGPFRRRRVKRLILEHCAAGPTRLVGLTKEIPRGTLYRHVDVLLKEGALKQDGRAYRTTAGGQQWLAHEQTHIEWDIFDRLYSPLASVPTAAHKALLELILAAVVSRRASFRQDHLCAFAAMGSTLRWKTSCGRMACAMLGVDPTVSVIDLASEAGKSLFVRRTHDGRLLSRRNVLSSPLAVIDDYLQASNALRAAVGPLLSGRRTIPFENGVIAVDCVTLLTMNPRPKPTLEEQTGLNPAQLRRLLLCDFNNVLMPDLSLTGHLALEAAQTQGPLLLPALRGDLQPHRPAFVELMRQVIRPECHERVDTEMLLNLAAGMTAFIDDDERALRQTAYDVAVTASTLGWTSPDWLPAVSQFSFHRATRILIEIPSPQAVSPADATDSTDTIFLRRRIMMTPNTPSASYTLSEETRARLILLADEEQISFAQAAEVVTEFFDRTAKAMGCDLHDLHCIMMLSKDLKLRELPVKHLKVVLQFLIYLHTKHLGMADVVPVVALFKRLQQFGLSVEAPELTRILDVACTIVTSGMSPVEVEQWLAQRPNGLSK